MRITKSKVERQEEIIKVAKELFFTNGYDKTSVSDIVDKVGVAKGLFYYYFKSKEEVFEAVMWDYANNLVEEFSEIFVNKTLTFSKKIDLIVEILFFRERHQQDILYLESGESKAQLELRQKLTMYATEKLIEPLSLILENEVAQKKMKNIDTVVTARFISYGVLGCSQFYHLENKNLSEVKNYVGDMIKMLLL